MQTISTSITSDAACRVLVAAVVACGCDRFPRDNPVEDAKEDELILRSSEDAILVNDAIGGGPFNNANSIVEPRETVLLTFPVEVAQVPAARTAYVTAKDSSDGNCVTALVERGMEGARLLRADLPPTMGDTPVSLLVGPVELTLGKDCDPDAPLPLELEFRIVETDERATVEFTIDVGALSGRLALDHVAIDDYERGDREEDLDPGETVVLYPSLRNVGDAVLRDVRLTVAAADRDCVDSTRVRMTTNGAVSYADVARGQAASGGAGVVELVVDDACDPGDDLTLAFEVRDASEQTWVLPWSSALGARHDAGAGSTDSNAPASDDATGDDAGSP